MKCALVMIGYLVIFLGGVAVFVHMWRKDAKEAAKQKEKE